MTSQRSAHTFYLVLLLLSGLLSLYILRSFLVTLAVALVAAVVLYPVYRKFHTQVRGRDSLAALLTIGIACVCVIGPLLFIGSKVASEAYSVYVSVRAQATATDLDLVAAGLGQQLESFVPGAGAYAMSLSENIGAYAQKGAGLLAGSLAAVFSGVTGFAASLFIFILALYGFLVRGASLLQAVVAASPLGERDTHMLIAKTEQATTALVRGTLGTALIQGIVASIGFLIFGVPNAILWGMVTALAALIPGIGTMLVLIPTILYLWIFVGAPAALGLTVWGVVAVGSIDNIVGPRLSGSGTNLNLLMTLLSVFGGIALFGVAGIVLGPLCVSITYTIFSMYRTAYLATPEQTNTHTEQIV